MPLQAINKVFVLGTLTSVLFFVFQNCSKVHFATRVPASQEASAIPFCVANPTDSACISPPPAVCTFNGETIPEGGTVTAYQNSSVLFGQSCQSQTRVCHNGVLDGSYVYSQCQPDAPKSCLFNGQTISHGGSVTAAQNSSVPFGQACVFEQRTCNNGALSGSFSYSGCTVGDPRACLFNGQTVPHGKSVTAFPASSVPYGQQCTGETRTCYDGTLSGSDPYASCTPATPRSCLFNGQTVAHGQSVPAYPTASVPYGQLCVAETRTCSDGTLSGKSQYAACVIAAPAPCLFNNQTIASGQTVKGYQAPNVPFGGQCLSKDLLCVNGQIDTTGYTYGSCSNDPPRSCTFNNQTVPNGQSVPAYPTPTVPYGQICVSDTRTCNDGTLSGSDQYANCTPAAALPCTLNGQTVDSGGTIQAYPTATVPYGQQCTPETRICTNGVLSGSSTNPTCTVLGASSCSLNGQDIPSGQSVTVYQTATVPYGSQCVSEQRTCTNGVLSGSMMQPTCAPDSLVTNQIPITQSTSYLPFKLLLIVDNSYTMSQSQQKLQANIDSLLTPLKGRSINIKVVTTSDPDNVTPTYSWFATKDGQQWSQVSSSETPPSQWGDPSYVKLRDVVTYAENSGQTFTLKDSDSSDTTNATIAALKNYILGLGTNGSDTEKSFCPIIRHLYSQTTPSSFFQPNDRAAVVVLSDEDDSSGYDCGENSEVFTYDILQTTVVPATTSYSYYYTYSESEIDMNVTYTQVDAATFKDGIQVSPATSHVITTTTQVPPSAVSVDAYNAGNCPALGQTWGRNNIAPDLTVQSCNMHDVAGGYSYTSNSGTDPNYCDLSTKLPYIGRTLDQYDLSRTYVGNCSRTITPSQAAGYTTSNRSQISDVTSQYPLLPLNIGTFPGMQPGTTSINLMIEAIAQMGNLFGSNYFMAFIMNKPPQQGGTCALQPGQSYGVSYQNIATLYSTHIQTYDICSSSYQTAMSSVSNFVLNTAVSSYPLTLPGGAHVISVVLTHNGQQTTLDPAQYSYDGSQLQLKVSVQVGDQITVNSAPR